MSLVDVVAGLTGKCYMDKKLRNDIEQIRAESGLKEKDWMAFLNEKDGYPAEVQTKVYAPNADHVMLFDKDLEEIDSVMSETRNIIEKEAGECMSDFQYLDGSINFCVQTPIETLASVDENTGVDTRNLNNRLCYAAPYLYGASSDVDVSLEAQVTYNKFLNLQEESKINVKKAQKGKTGEEYFSQVLSQNQGRFFVLENIVIPSYDRERKTSETDAYIISSKGIFVCEVKNYGSAGQTLHLTDGKEWWVENDCGCVLRKMDSAFVQNRRHCNATKGFIREHLGIEVPIIPVAVIANDLVDIKLESNNIAIRAGQIYDLIASYPDVVDYETQKKIVETFKEKQLDANDFEINLNADRAKYIKDVVLEYIPYMKANAKIADTYVDACKKNRLIAKGITALLAVIGLLPAFAEGEWLLTVFGILAWFLACTAETKLGTISGIVAVVMLPIWLISGNLAMGGVFALSAGLCFFKSKG